mgnify:CR=1 FL=1
MKRIKKLAAAMLTAIMMMTMTVTAYAAGDCTLTVNVKSGEGVPTQTLKDQTINLYKLFDVTESDSTTTSGTTKNYAYTVNESYKSTLASVLSIPENSTNEQIVQAVTALGESNNAKVQKFANDFTAEALKKSLTETTNSGKLGNVNSYEFTGLDAGYYLVYVTGGKEIQSSLVTVDKTTKTVNLKTEAPSITKEADKTTVEIGQVVKYTVTGSIPDTTGYSEYVYKIHDELSTGLDFVNDKNGTALEAGATTVNVKVAFTDAGVTAVGTAPTTATLDTGNNRKMSLDLSTWVRDNQANKGKEFTVTYYAKVNKGAVVTEKNKAQLEYGNKPGETTTTTPSEAKTPTYPLDILKKKSGSKEKLAGAKFELYKNEADAKAGTNAIKVSGSNGNYVVDSNSKNTVFESVASIDGQEYNLHLNGLAAGDYWLKETEAPAGFNKLTDPVKITITKTGDTEWTVKKNDAKEEDKIIDIENSTGSLLPSTGGTGVIVFAGVAILLVFGVVVSFIRDKRKAC